MEPTDYTYHMTRALVAASYSPDPSTQNGAVLLNRFDAMIGVGWNDFPKGVGAGYWHGRKEEKYARVVHAEVAAILDAARHGAGVRDTTLVCPWAACSNCAKHMAAAGVTRLVRHAFSNSGVTTGSHWYADCQVGDDILTSAGVEIIEIEPVTSSDIQLRRDGKLWPATV